MYCARTHGHKKKQRWKDIKKHERESRDASPVSGRGGAAIGVIEWMSVRNDRGAAEDKVEAEGLREGGRAKEVRRKRKM